MTDEEGPFLMHPWVRDDPDVGSRWRADGLRHVWTVTKVGRRYVWLKSSHPDSPPLRHEKSGWPGGWRPA